jgi:hypothetical protein
MDGTYIVFAAASRVTRRREEFAEAVNPTARAPGGKDMGTSGNEAIKMPLRPGDTPKPGKCNKAVFQVT